MNQVFRVCVVSTKRALSIRKYTLALFPDADVIVPPDEVGEYKMNGVGNVYPQRGKGVSAARNTILDMFGKDSDILMLDDDVRVIGLFTLEKKAVPLDDPAKRVETLARLFAYTYRVGGLVFGCSPTSNAFFYNPQKRISTNLFLVGTFTGYVRGCKLRYDESLKLKEDYDYTVRVWKECGMALRFNDIYCEAVHRVNKGGAVAIRTSALEQEVIATLIHRWPKYIRPNPRRKNEVILRLP